MLFNPFRRGALSHRPALMPAPGMAAYEVEASTEIADAIEEGRDEDRSRWEWRERFDACAVLPAPLGRAGRNGG